ncbi:MAG: nuclear transport factor 2 family protein [Burkholderiales bacterium]
MASEPSTLMATYVRAWNEHNADDLLRCLTPDCVYEDTALRKTMPDPASLRAFVDETARDFPDVRFNTVTLAEGPGHATWEWVMAGHYVAPARAGQPEKRKPISVRGVSVIQLRDGKVCNVRDYWNREVLRKQLAD